VKIQGRIFLVLSVFLLAAAIVYGLWSKEPAGTTALFLSFGLAIMIGYYLLFTARRVDTGAQDRDDADVEGRGRRPVGLRPVAGVGDLLPAAAAQLPVAAAHPLGVAGLRPPPPGRRRAGTRHRVALR